MIRNRVVFVALLGLGCRSAPESESAAPARADSSAHVPVEDSSTPEEATPSFSMDEALERITASDLRAHIEYLADDAMAGRPTPSAELDRAAQYIAEHFAAAGLQPSAGLDGYMQHFECGRESGKTSANVVAELRGTGGEEAIILSAHYDHIGTSPTGDDRVFNGANDNASGVAALLELADVFGRAPQTFERTLIFVAFCGEERGLLGSRHYVTDPVFPLEQTVAMLNFEMLGHPDSKAPRQAWVTGHDFSNLHEVLTAAGRHEDVSFVAGHAIGRVEGNAFHRSDNYPLAEQGVVAHSISTGPLDEHYHALTDELELINVDTMRPIVRALAWATHALATQDVSPAWTDAAPESVKH